MDSMGSWGAVNGMGMQVVAAVVGAICVFVSGDLQAY
jgi:hypothetical protein